MIWKDATQEREAWTAALVASGHPSVLQSAEWGDFMTNEGRRVRRFVIGSGEQLAFQAWRVRKHLPIYWSPEGGFRISNFANTSEEEKTGTTVVMVVAPFDRGDLPPRPRIRIPRTVSHPENVVVDLRVSEDDLLRQAHQKWRNAYRSAVRSRAENREVDLDEFLECESLLRNEVERSKQFRSPWSTERLRALAYSGLRTIATATLIEGSPISCMLSVVSGSCAMLLTASVGAQGRKVNAGYLDYWTTARRLRDFGVRSWNLGGADSRVNPGVARFKMRGGGKSLELPGAFCVF